MFGMFEYGADLKLREEIRVIREEMQEKYKFSKEDFEKLEDVVVSSIPFKAGTQWSFMGSIYFS
jgi:hypothetical protein